jgi:hypothetical protein
MTRQFSKRKRLVFSVLAAAAVAVLPLARPLFTFLWFPGSLVGYLLFGPRIISASFNQMRALVSAVSAILWSIILYFGTDLWRWGQAHPTRRSPTATKYISLLWVVLLIPWLLVAGISGMAFDGGHTAEAYAFFWSVWAYPITVGIAAVFRRWVPSIVLLPLLTLAGCATSQLLHK